MFQILQVSNISCKYKTFLWKQYFVVFKTAEFLENIQYKYIWQGNYMYIYNFFKKEVYI